MIVIPLSGKNAAGRVAIVDGQFADEVLKYRWQCVRGYARRSVYCGKQDGRPKTRRIRMHREVLRLAGVQIPGGYQTDHINGNKLDNRLSNLRVVTHQQNMHNRKPQGGGSRYKGVYWDKSAGKWRAQIWHNGKRIHLGLFIDEIEAAKAYDVAARRLFGEYARCNFPIEKEMMNAR